MQALTHGGCRYAHLRDECRNRHGTLTAHEIQHRPIRAFRKWIHRTVQARPNPAKQFLLQ
jgi:hypothetical protein